MIMRKFKGLSANTIKYIAIVLMTVDHVAFAFVNPNSVLYYLMRLLGRLTCPIMCYFIAEGFRYTRNKMKYLRRMTVFALISQPIYFVMVFGRPPLSTWEFFTNWNVLYTFTVSLLMLLIMQSEKLSIRTKVILVTVAFAFADFGDWGCVISAWVLVFHLFRGNFKKQAVGFISVSLLLMTCKFLPAYESFMAFSYQYGVLLALVPLRLYSGERGDGRGKVMSVVNKWLFYLYYPTHMGVIILAKIYLLKGGLSC